MLAATPIGWQSGQLAPLDSELDEAELFEDLEHETGVGEIVGYEALAITVECPEDLARSIAPGDDLSHAEHRVCHCVERMVLHLDERAANEVDPVEDDATGNRGLRRRWAGSSSANPETARRAAEVEPDTYALRDPVENAKIEVDNVPARNDVGVDLAYALAERHEEIPLAGMRPGTGRRGEPPRRQ